jgi:hypothetical protein
MYRAYVSVAVVLVFVVFSVTGAQAALTWEIVPGAGYLTGYSLFQIGDVPKEDDIVTPPRNPYFPISELSFPLMSGIATVDARASLGPFTLEGGVKQNFSHHSGMMRDYDWGMPYYEDGSWWVLEHTNGEETWYDLDVESKSRARLEARMWNVKASWKFYTYSYDKFETDWLTGRVDHRKGDFSVSLGAGYEKRKFDFDCTLVKQWSPSGHNDVYYYEGDGSVTNTYTVDYSIPYLALSVEDCSDKVDFGMDFGVSTLVHVRDNEVHLARIPGPINNDGYLSGNALMLDAHLRYDITPRVFVGISADYVFIRASGMQHQHIDAGSAVVDGDLLVWDDSDYSIKEKVKSEQSCFTFNVGFRFGK